MPNEHRQLRLGLLWRNWLVDWWRNHTQLWLLFAATALTAATISATATLAAAALSLAATTRWHSDCLLATVQPTGLLVR